MSQSSQLSIGGSFNTIKTDTSLNNYNLVLKTNNANSKIDLSTNELIVRNDISINGNIFNNEISIMKTNLDIIMNHLNNSGISFENTLQDNIDASFALYIQTTELKSGNLDLSFGNLDILENLNVDGDVSFNSNVDISNDLNIGGKIGLSNPNDFGDDGAILTSRGSTASVTWVKPYYFGANLSSNQNLSSNDEVQIDFVPYLPYPYDDNNIDMSAGIWTCPTTGLYKISLRAIISAEDDNIRNSDIYIISNNGSTDTRESSAKYFNSIDDNIQVGTLNCESLSPLTIGDTLRAVGRIVLSSGTIRNFEETATAGGKGTELIITKII